MNDQSTLMSHLSIVMAIQIMALIAYGFAFFFVPTWCLADYVSVDTVVASRH